MAIFSTIVEQQIEVFVNYFSILGCFYWCSHNLSLVHKMWKGHNLMLIWEKCHFTVLEALVLGHKISAHVIEVNLTKIEVIEKISPPTLMKAFLSYLGYACFVEDSSRTSPKSLNLYATSWKGDIIHVG